MHKRHALQPGIAQTMVLTCKGYDDDDDDDDYKLNQWIKKDKYDDWNITDDDGRGGSRYQSSHLWCHLHIPSSRTGQGGIIIIIIRHHHLNHLPHGHRHDDHDGDQAKWDCARILIDKGADLDVLNEGGCVLFIFILHIIIVIVIPLNSRKS